VARPVGFDREQVLADATKVFWAHGYFDTSVSKLVDATRLQPGSLYAAFESKEGLFLAALDHYAGQSLARLRKILGDAPDPLQGVRRFLEEMAEADPEAAVRGCFLVNTVLEVGRRNAAVQARLRQHLTVIEHELAEALNEARAAGLLAPRKSPGELAKFLMATIWGVRVLGSTGAGADDARTVLGMALSVLDA